MNLEKASQYRKEENYTKAIGIYKALWDTNAASFNEWDIWGYAYSLFKTKDYQDTLNIAREGYKIFPNFEMLHSLYARSIYYTQFKANPPPNLSTLKKALDAILKLHPPHQPYSVAPTAIFEFAKIAMKQNVIHWKEIEEYLLKLEPELLDDKAFEFKNKGRDVSIASDYEKWYACMIRVKGGLNQPKELLDLLDQARSKNIKWHYNNDIWFERKEAFAYNQLGEVEKAIKIMKSILARKKDWFLIYDLAKLFPEDSEEKGELLCEAALAKGPYAMKLKLYDDLYTFFKTIDKDIAQDHLKLIATLRIENDWDIPQRVSLLLDGKDWKEKSSSFYLKKLRNIWKKYLPEKEKLEGRIITIFPNGNAGFIKADNESYFFSINDIKDKESIEKNQKVVFEWVESFDKKKNKMSKKAINIQLK